MSKNTGRSHYNKFAAAVLRQLPKDIGEIQVRYWIQHPDGLKKRLGELLSPEYAGGEKMSDAPLDDRHLPPAVYGYGSEF